MCIKTINCTNAMLVLYTWWEVCQEEYLMDFIHDIYNLFWGDLFTIPLPGGKTIGISLLVLILIPSGIFFSVKTKFLPIRMFKEMVKIAVEKTVSAFYDFFDVFFQKM